MNNFREKADLIWNLANLLRGDYKPHEYADVILPLVVLRRLDQAMAPTRAAVRQAYDTYKGKLENLHLVLSKAAGNSSVYNYSEFDWERLLNAPSDLAQNLVAYFNGFSPDVQDILEKFDFRRQVSRLQAANLLYPILKAFEEVDLHPDRVPNHEMGMVFEELIRRFSEQYNETAGEHFTPREVIALMVELLLCENGSFIQPGKIIEVYDPACGTGGMLTEARRAIIERSEGMNSPPIVYLFGQEINPTSYAVAKADLLLKGEDPSRLAFGNSFSEDGHAGKRFRLMLSNPPFGVEWKKVEHIIRNEHETKGHDGRFGAGLPRITDGSFLFLQHMLAKRFEDESGSRIAIIFNGSPLFTGDAGSGESEIRRWILENDWLEGIVALPEQIFYNTGIATYIWILTNRKSARRKGKVTLVNAADFWAPMTPRSLGNKRRLVTRQHNGMDIVELYRAMENNDYCRVFENADFGYRRVRIERPLRLNFHAAPERIERLKEQPAFAALSEKEPLRATALLDALRRLPDRPSRNPAEYLRWLDDAVETLHATSLPKIPKITPTLRKAILNALTERDETALPVPVRFRVEPLHATALPQWEPDPDLRDHENVPLKYAPPTPVVETLHCNVSTAHRNVSTEDMVFAYFEREVKPYLDDAWIDQAFCDDKDGKVGVVGYEINFNRYFYKYTPPPHPAELARQIQEKERQIADLLREWL
ncbi:class I SAM-dependent DNA methyltransferase [uncultured Chloroflexus sp.]|uniref:type I restriction-modification system subunit M n=2 Tax=uncultured Chloroflexus sp. TaxID=214040 RepID=UPI002601B288|nr:class I SAM-dependent DNA methyltransferase [uncultured Chloroflexus sp.]